MLRFSVLLLFFAAWVWSAKPMESIKNYNVILVHGAADMRSGLDCKDSVGMAYDYVPFVTIDSSVDVPDSTEYLKRIGGYGSAYFWDDDFHGGFLYQRKSSNATGMVSELNEWLTENIFENDKRAVYLQRPFINPAGSPFENGKELGQSSWKGENKCNVRRSLIEEAQEVKAKGRTKLSDLRNDVSKRDSLPASRNILIAHSMGGVASREYVQGDYYNSDVDKVITLDSPHEGTEALSLLVDKTDELNNIISPAAQFLSFGSLMAAFGDDFFLNYYSILAWVVGTSYGLSELLDIVLRITLPYTKDDPLVPYIDPNNFKNRKKDVESVEDLRTRGYDSKNQIPMFRLLYATKSLTFTDPNNSFAKMLLGLAIPDALNISTRNFYSQIKNSDNPMNFRINSAFASMYMGAALGLGFEDNGSSLIPSWSGSAANTPFLNNADVDVKKVPYDAAFSSGDIPTFAAIVEASAVAMEVASVALSWAPEFKFSAKIIIMAAASGCALPFVAASIIPFYDDFDASHRAPTLSKRQSQWLAAPNAYSKILGGQESVTPLRMEEFLYEKPFVSLRVSSANDILETPLPSNPDSLGLLGSKRDTVDGVVSKVLAPLSAINRDATRKSKLDFKNSGDWEQLGAKVDRWVRVAGVEGDSAVPIRHAERYAMPGVSVTEFIEQYRFIVDDLMPHRLRQIRLNFNFREDIAWECRVDLSEDSQEACDVYMRSSDGQGWVSKGKRPHPVKKNGAFDFSPGDFYNEDNGYNLSAIQKDNQNTVVLSMVNKMGLVT